MAMLVAFSSALIGQAPPTISSFPYQPSDAQLATDCKVNYGTGPAPGGSAWQNGVISGNRRGTGGASVQAWANRPTANYQANTTSWLHSPIFNLSGQSGLLLEFELWIRAQSNYDGMKLQVSTNGGTVWTDVTTQSATYNGNTNSSNLLASKFGGGNNAWTNTTTYGGGSATTCRLSLNPWANQSDVRFRWCFVSNGSTHNNGPVVDGLRVLHVTATTVYSSGYAAVPQGSTVNATITKTAGDAFAMGQTVYVEGSGVTGTVLSVQSANQCTVAFTAQRTADAGPHTYYIRSGSTDICRGTMEVFYPQQRVSAREAGSAQEPPQNAAVGGNGVYLHNGEFRHDLPILSLPGRMLPLSVGLTYRSQLEYLGPLGAGWTASFDRRLYYFAGTDTIDLRSGDGRIDTFTNLNEPLGPGFTGPYVRAGIFCEIVKYDSFTPDPNDDVYTIHYPHGSTATFSATNLDTAGARVFRETAFADRYGNAVQCIYDMASGQLTEMRGDLYSASEPDRHRLLFEYGLDGRLSAIEDHADYAAQSSVIGASYTGPRRWEFAYNSSAQLTEIRLPQTERYYSDTQGANYRTTVKFLYDANDNLTEVIDARQANEASPVGWLACHVGGGGFTDQQDVGRAASTDTTKRQFIARTSATDVSVVNAEGFRTRYTLNANGTLAAVKHYTGKWDSTLTQIGAKIRASDPDWYETTYLYDGQFNLTKATLPRGNYVQYHYDTANTSQRAKGNLLRVLSHPGSAGTSGLPADQVNGLLATFTYTSNYNQLATSCGPRGYELKSSYNINSHDPADIQNDRSADFTTTNTYHAKGTLQKTTSPAVDNTNSPDTLNAGQYLETTFTYNSFGQLETATDQAGYRTRYEYGTTGYARGYLLRAKAGDQTAAPLVSKYSYNSVGRVITVTDPRGYTWTSYINQLDQAVRSETPQASYHGNAVYYSETLYDRNGNVETHKVANIDENGTPGFPTTINTTYSYNILDIVTAVTEPVDAVTDRTTSFSYDNIFRTLETMLPEGNRTATDYDELNRPIKSYAGYDGSAVPKAGALLQGEVFYDLNSNIVRSLDGRGNDSHLTFDAYDRVTKSEDRLATPNDTSFVYNQAGQVTQTTRTGLRRQWNGSVFVNNTATLAQSEVQYDNLGRAYLTKTLAVNNSGFGLLGYSPSESQPQDLGLLSNGRSTSRVKFRVNGQLDETRDDLGYPTRYTYDAYNRLKTVSDDRDGGGANDNSDEYFYDANSNVIEVVARLHDDAQTSPGPHKVLSTTFDYDSLNRLVADHSPIINGARLDRTYRYDSRSNLVRSTDRKGIERATQYDLLDRPVRSLATNTRRDIGANGLTLWLTEDIISTTAYTRNSEVAYTIDPTGNKTYLRYDLAGRWLQTQHADGDAGTPHKTTAGNGHSVTAVGSGPYYSKAGAYDANGNLLAVTDPNGTVTSWSYDANDQPTTETGDTSASAPLFGVQGETGLGFAYDGLYRPVYGETHDGIGSLTETDNAFDTLGGLERQRQRVLRPHPNFPNADLSEHMVSA
ncbi:MAG: RHS repeat protein, partial [Planctomycetes bacterium]|nr:RHS repeat protein [Planctomycetota bacterium]